MNNNLYYTNQENVDRYKLIIFNATLKNKSNKVSDLLDLASAFLEMNGSLLDTIYKELPDGNRSKAKVFRQISGIYAKYADEAFDAAGENA